MKFFTLFFVLLALTSCSTQTFVNLEPVGGSKADGTITLAYEYGLFQQPVADWDVANSKAAKACKAWGYSSAQPFGEHTSKCVWENANGGCWRTQVSVPYQCVQ